MPITVLAIALTLNVCEAAEPAASSEANETVHAELRALRDAIFAAWNARDMNALLEHVDENVVVTWQNAQVTRGHDGLKAFYAEMIDSDNPIVADIKSRLEVDEASILHGEDTAIAFGTMRDEITLGQTLSRAPFLDTDTPMAIDSRWSATVVKRDDGWKLASYHVSNDLFDNAVLDVALGSLRTAAYMASAVGVLMGVALMLLVRRFGGTRAQS